MTTDQLADLLEHMKRRLELDPRCHEDIVCPDCKEWTTRHEPCCAGTPQCECTE